MQIIQLLVLLSIFFGLCYNSVDAGLRSKQATKYTAKENLVTPTSTETTSKDKPYDNAAFTEDLTTPAPKEFLGKKILTAFNKNNKRYIDDAEVNKNNKHKRFIDDTEINKNGFIDDTEDKLNEKNKRFTNDTEDKLNENAIIIRSLYKDVLDKANEDVFEHTQHTLSSQDDIELSVHYDEKEKTYKADFPGAIVHVVEGKYEYPIETLQKISYKPNYIHLQLKVNLMSEDFNINTSLLSPKHFVTYKLQMLFDEEATRTVIEKLRSLFTFSLCCYLKFSKDSNFNIEKNYTLKEILVSNDEDDNKQKLRLFFDKKDIETFYKKNIDGFETKILEWNVDELFYKIRILSLLLKYDIKDLLSKFYNEEEIKELFKDNTYEEISTPPEKLFVSCPSEFLIIPPTSFPIEKGVISDTKTIKFKIDTTVIAEIAA